jgi:hypothetical protein
MRAPTGRPVSDTAASHEHPAHEHQPATTNSVRTDRPTENLQSFLGGPAAAAARAQVYSPTSCTLAIAAVHSARRFSRRRSTLAQCRRTFTLHNSAHSTAEKGRRQLMPKSAIVHQEIENRPVSPYRAVPRP